MHFHHFGLYRVAFKYSSVFQFSQLNTALVLAVILQVSLFNSYLFLV